MEIKCPYCNSKNTMLREIVDSFLILLQQQQLGKHVVMTVENLFMCTLIMQ